MRHLKTMKNKRNLKTKWLLLQNDRNADTTLLHSHDEMFHAKVLIKRLPSFSDPKITVIWHVKPILKLQQTWQTWTVLWKTARTLKGLCNFYIQTNVLEPHGPVSNLPIELNMLGRFKRVWAQGPICREKCLYLEIAFMQIWPCCVKPSICKCLPILYSLPVFTLGLSCNSFQFVFKF